MKPGLIKFIFLFIALTTMFSCKKELDGPVPSTRNILTSKTWIATSKQDPLTGIIVPIIPAKCQGLVVQFSNDGRYYLSNGCELTHDEGGWFISEKTINILDTHTQYVITSIDTKSMTATLLSDEDPVIVRFTAL